MTRQTTTSGRAPYVGSEKAVNPLAMILISCAVALVVTVLCAYAAGVSFWFPEQASTVAADVDGVFNVITWICIFFFVLIVMLMTWFCVKFRMRNHSKASSDVTHNTPLELTWTIIPLILVIAIFYVGMMGYLNLRRPPAGAYEVNVTAQRWSWSFAHRNGYSDPAELVVPVGRPVKLLMQSNDVLHALFIPAFRVKQDIVPGRVTYLWFEATKPGNYDLVCAEYCGKDHSLMIANVKVLPEDQFQAEIDKRARWFEGKPEDQLYTYAAEKIYPRCKSCHTLDGKDGTGPSWRGLWETLATKPADRIFTDGTNLADIMGPGKLFESPEDYIQQSILNPHMKIRMNFTSSMPTFKGQLKPEELVAIRDFIKRLEEFDDTGKPRPGSDAEKLIQQRNASPSTQAESRPQP